MNKLKIAFILFCSSGWSSAVMAQRTLTLDSCRALALSNNKQLQVARVNKEMTGYAKKSARTQYLPKVDAVAGYSYFSREISLLSKDQKSALSNMGTIGVNKVSGDLSTGINNQLQELVSKGTITAEEAQKVGGVMQQFSNGPISQYVAGVGNTLGQKIVDAFHTDTHNIFAGSIFVRQPIYMGGAITAANRMADIAEEMADDNISLKKQSTLYSIDQAYWLVVSLRQKQKLAYSFRDLVKKLDNDVSKMIKQGVATKADGLKVKVRVNEADMQITQVEDGLTLSKMLLCQLCGLPMDDNITLADENKDQIDTSVSVDAEQQNSGEDLSGRPEVRLLQKAIDLSEQSTKLARAARLPHVAFTGGYSISNPNVFNGYQKNFSGVWNVGIAVQVNVWDWNEIKYKVRAAKSATSMACLELADTQEKINLQVTQSRFKVKEARKKLAMAEKNISSAEENLRCAQVGFKEGVMGSTEVLAAQTAWQLAQSLKIDAQVEVKLAQVGLEKALGTLQ